MAKQIDNVTCLACGCVCDDLVIHVDADQIVAADRACLLCESLLLGRKENETCSAEIGGEPASLEAAIERASNILANSAAPLVCGLARSTIETQRVAIELADRLGATLDPALSPFHRAALVALQSVGISTCTLGEVKQRADVILFWGCDPVSTHPRFLERFIEPPGKFVPQGRTVIVVSAQSNAAVDIADDFLQVEPGSDFEVLAALRAIVEGTTIDGNTFGGILLEQVRALAVKLQAANYCVLFFGPGIAEYGNAAATLESLFLLVRQLNNTSRCCAVGLGGPIAENVLTWQTGYPCGVNFAAGYPSYDADGYSANRLLERGEVDSVLMIGSRGFEHLSESAHDRLYNLPVILLETAWIIPCGENRFNPTVRIPVAQPGLQTGGSVFRMDGVPLPLRQVIESQLPSEKEVLAAILESVLVQCS